MSEKVRAGEIENIKEMENLPDLPEAVNHPLFKQLVLVSGIIFRRKSPVVVNPREMDNDILAANTRQEAFVYGTCLAEFITRVAKGIIPVEIMETEFSEQTIKEQVIGALNLLVDAGDMKIVRREQTISGEWIPPESSMECVLLENIIRDIIDTGLLTAAELQKGIRNGDLFDFFQTKFAGEQSCKPTFTAQYFSPPDANQSEIHRRIERAHTYFDLSGIAREVEEEGAKITFSDDEAPTQRHLQTLDAKSTKKGTTLVSVRTPFQKSPSAPPSQTGVSEAREIDEVVTIPGMIVELDPGGDELGMPILLEDEIHTIGTGLINDYVVSGDENTRTEVVHGIIFAKNGKIFIKAASAPLKLEKERYEVNESGEMIHREYPGNNLVLTNTEKEVEPGRVFYLMPRGGHFEDPASFPCFTVKESAKMSKKKIAEELKRRFDRFMKLKAARLFLRLNEGDPKVARTFLEEVAVAEKKMDRLEETAARYGIRIFKEGERESALDEALRPLGTIVNNKVEGFFRKIAYELFKHLKENAPLSLKDRIKVDFIHSHEGCAPLAETIDKHLAFARSFGIPVMSFERAENLRDQVLEKVERKRLELLKQKEEEAKEQVRRTEEQMKALREKSEKMRRIGGDPSKIHLGEGEELDENTKYEYEGPAVRIADGHFFSRLDPLLLDEISVGDHPANTHRVPKRRTPKNSTADFMARIRKDRDGFRLSWLGGSLSFTGTGEVLSGPEIRLEPGRIFKLASYHVAVEEGHKYSLQALKQVCPSLAKELMEVVFNMDETSEGQDTEALQNLQTLVEKGYVDGKFVEGIMAYGMAKLKKAIKEWNPGLPAELEDSVSDDEEGIRDDHMPVAGIDGALRAFIDEEMARHPLNDAHWLRTMKMLSDISGKGGFFEKIGVGGNTVFLKKEALRRAESYCAIDAEKDRMMEQDQSSLSLRRIKGVLSDKARAENTKLLFEMKAKSAAGAVQIARLCEMGLLDLNADVAGLPDAAADYIIQIREVIGLRKLLGRVGDGEFSVAEIPEIMGKSKGKHLEDVLSADEIVTANHNIEVNLRANSLLEYYVSKMLVAAGKKAFRKAATAEDSRAQVELIDGLMARGLLDDTDLMQLPLMPVESVRATLEELRSNARYLDGADKLKLMRSDGARKEMLELQGVAVEVDETLASAAREEDLEALLEVADTVNDGVLALRMRHIGMTMPAIRRIEGPDNLQRALKMVANIDRDRTWDNVRSEYYALAIELGRLEVNKILACDDSDYRMMILAEAVGKGVFRYEDLGVAPEQMRADVEGVRALTKARLIEANKTALREKYFNRVQPCEAELDDLDYLNQLQLHKIVDPVERYIAEDVMMSLTERKRAQIKENIARGEDVAYMRMLENEINETLAEIYEKMPMTADPLIPAPAQPAPQPVPGVDKGKQSVY